MYECIFICLSTSTYPPINVCIHPFIYLCLFTDPSFYFSMCLSFYVSIPVSIYLPIYLSFFSQSHLSISPCVYLYMYLTLYQSIYLSIHHSFHLSVYLSILTCWGGNLNSLALDKFNRVIKKCSSLCNPASPFPPIQVTHCCQCQKK